MKSSNFYRFVLLNVLVIFHFIYFFLSTTDTSGFCCTVNAFTLLKYFQPNTGSTIRQQVFKTFRLELAWADWELQFQAAVCTFTSPLYMMQHKFTSARRRKECGTTDGIAPDLGHFPIKGQGDIRCRRCGKALCIITGIHPRKAPPALSATTPSGLNEMRNETKPHPQIYYFQGCATTCVFFPMPQGSLPTRQC